MLSCLVPDFTPSYLVKNCRIEGIPSFSASRCARDVTQEHTHLFSGAFRECMVLPSNMDLLPYLLRKIGKQEAKMWYAHKPPNLQV